MKKTEKVISYETPEVEIVDCGSDSAYCQQNIGGSQTDPDEEVW